MPTSTLGKKIKGVDRTEQFIQLKSKDQKVKLRFVTPDYAYEGKHFIKDDNGKYTVTDCTKINNEVPCDLCEQYYDLIEPSYVLRKELKELEKNKTDENKARRMELKSDIEDIKKKASPYKVTVSFYYPVLKRGITDLDHPEAAVFKTTLSIRLKLEREQADGIDITKFDYIITRTEETGAGHDYYSFTRVDSAMTKSLTEEEIKLMEVAIGWDLETLTQGKRHTTAQDEEADESITDEDAPSSKTSTDDDLPEDEEEMPF